MEDKIATLAAQAARAVAVGSQATSTAAARITPPLLPSHSQEADIEALNGHFLPGAPAVETSSIPSDPVELAIWIAQQISHFREGPADNVELTMEVETISTHLDDNNLPSSQFLNSNGVDSTESRKKLRDDNRERKKRWRSNNTIRNRDNDLRTRIKKRAKSLYGDYHSNEKSAWVEQEYIKRRSKRESRARSTARRFKQFSGVSIHPDVRSTLFSPTNQDGAVGDPSLQHTGDLLLNALLCKGKRDGDHSIEFQRAIKNGSISPKSLDRAIRIIAQNPDIMQEIKTLLDDIEEDEGIDATSGEDNGTPPMQSTEMQPATAGHFPPVAETQSTDVIRALNAATALLNEMADTKVYVTPYANPPPRNVATNGALTVNGTDRKKTRGTTKQAMSGHGLDQSQIDALLALANGGSLTDDEDDLDEGQDTNGNSSDQPGPAQTDSAITATLQRIINHLMAERSGGIDRGLAPTSSLVEAYGSQAVRDQAATLQSLFSQAGVSINTIIPRAQSHATSQLYANLSTRARSSTPSGGINPAHAGSYGNTAQMQQRMLANPGIFAQAQHFQKRPLEAAKSSSRGNMVGLPVRASTPARSKNPEELRKIKTYGFPPLPGSRPGAKKT